LIGFGVSTFQASGGASPGI